MLFSLHHKHENNFWPYKLNILFGVNLIYVVCFAGSGHTLWQYRVPDKNGELTKSYASDFHVHGQEARKIRVLKQIEGVEDLLNLKTTMERSKSQHIREDRNFDRLPVSSWSDPSRRVVLLGDGKLLHACSPCPTICTHKFLLFHVFYFVANL